MSARTPELLAGSSRAAIRDRRPSRISTWRPWLFVALGLSMCGVAVSLGVGANALMRWSMGADGAARRITTLADRGGTLVPSDHNPSRMTARVGAMDSVERELADPDSDTTSAADAATETARAWPPARAYTARCRIPGGGCDSYCTALAGDRCLDPCFIHTEQCAEHCRRLDGSCGWPPPDAE